MTREDYFEECEALLDCAEPKRDPDEELICVDCNGSGEGQYDGTKCSACGGKGVER